MDRERVLYPVIMATQPKQQKPVSYTQLSRLIRARSKEYTLQSLFQYGYRNKEDISNLPPQTLVVGSQNVLTNAAELVGIRQGYTLDGTSGTQNNFGIDSNYDFLGANGEYRNLRKWNSNLELRYLNPVTNIVSWVNILSTLNNTITPVNFTNFYDQDTELKTFCLFVNNDTNVYEWSGGVASFLSASNATGIIATIDSTTPVPDGGTGYKVGDILTIAGGGATVLVTSINPIGPPDGVVTGVQLITNGSGYSSGISATTGGSGTGCTINIASVGNGSVTISGSQTLSQLGFYDNSTNSAAFILIINGTQYTYAASNTNFGTTFVGFSVDMTSQGFNIGDPIIQLPRVGITTSNSFLGANVTISLISTLANQVWYGSPLNNNVWVSKTNDYTDITFSSPARLPSEGALINIDSYPIAFFPQSNQMYISAGMSQWWVSQTNQQTVSTTSGGNTIATPTETLYATKLKVATNQGAQSQGLVNVYKNSIIFVSNEPILNSFGLVQDILADPQMVNISDPIKYDMDAYDFTGGQVLYDNYFIYVLIPANGVVRMYNVVKNYWEAPQTIPISRIYRVTGSSSIYGHSSLTNESYELFTGYNDNGNPINAVAAFPYTCISGGAPNEKKNFNKLFTEGYISSNTTLMATINYDFGGFSGTYTALINGNKGNTPTKNTIFNKITDGSLGQNTLGSQPIGTILNIPPAIPKFRIVNTMPRINVFEYQIVYSTNDVDQQWTLLRFGPAVNSADDLPTEITI